MIVLRHDSESPFGGNVRTKQNVEEEKPSVVLLAMVLMHCHSCSVYNLDFFLSEILI